MRDHGMPHRQVVVHCMPGTPLQKTAKAPLSVPRRRCNRRRMTSPPGHRSLRAGRISLPGHIYLLTTVTAYRRPLFKNSELARAACRSIHEQENWGDASLLCWVLMPDHWHGLVQLGHCDSLPMVMNRFKAAVARQLNCTRTAVVWGRGYHDRALRHQDDIRTVARYIVANPLRAGLVDSVLDYPYWNCIWL